jgi:SpoVK/Ycf46/Vps4 family AAA+-type ATPase
VGTKELRALSSVILKDGQKEKILHDIQTFRRRDRWYASRGIPYRRGYLLFGPPGTGKTSLVQSIASKVNMNVAIISLSGNMDDENFNVMLQEVPRNSILVMEDIDHCIIKDPSSSKTEGTSKITMSGLLNALDGVVAQEGTMIFMTCNDVNKIQPALLRPGRIDMKMELGYADKSQISQMFWRFIGPDEEELAKMRKNSIVSDHPLEINEQQADFEASRKELEELERKFTDAIPDLTVTPAELQNFFIMNTMNQEENDMDYSFVLDGIPEFLESVQRDREQALMHKNQSNNISNENNNTTATTATSTQEEEKA